MNILLFRGADTIQRYPRNVESTVRREDGTRKEARERRKARKAEEIARKQEEVKRLKALKMREIRRKLDLVSKESGGLAPEGKVPWYLRNHICELIWCHAFIYLDLQELDLEGDWDPSKHDAQMASLYGFGEEEQEDAVSLW
jgi:protein KRI1